MVKTCKVVLLAILLVIILMSLIIVAIISKTSDLHMINDLCGLHCLVSLLSMLIVGGLMIVECKS